MAAVQRLLSPPTSIVNYTNEVNGRREHLSAGLQDGQLLPPTSPTSPSNAMPDIIVKAAFDPSFGHYEIFGVGRYAHETVYSRRNHQRQPLRQLEGHRHRSHGRPALTTAGSYNTASPWAAWARAPALRCSANRLTVGLKGLYGPGVGRYGATTLSDV